MESHTISQVKTDPSDEVIVDRVRDGEIGLFGILVRRHYQRIYRIVYRLLRNSDDTEDAIQQGHLQALIHLNQFTGRSAYVTWITRIMINAAFTAIRVRRTSERNLPRISEDPSYGLSLRSNTWNPEQQAVKRELNVLMTAALNSLPEQHRTILTLRDIQEVSTAEAAVRLGITEQCAKVRLSRARGLLRTKLATRLRPPCKV